MADQDRITLEELEQRSGVPARQIRELIRLGVIPAPSSRGRGATYGDEHAERLRAWKRLKADSPPGTTNEQLRSLIDRLADQGLLRSIADGSVPFAMVGEREELPSFSPREASVGDVAQQIGSSMQRVNEEAVAYLASMRHADPARVLMRRDRSQSTLEVDPRAARRAGSALALSRLRAALEQYVAAAGSPVRVNPNRSEIWHRVSATRDIEITARGPLAPDEIQLLETIGQLLQQAIYRKER